MKKTIMGFRYDTNSGIKIGSYSHPDWHAALYKAARADRYFLAGRGGKMSIFGGRERIIEMSAEDAKKWADKYLPAARVAEFF